MESRALRLEVETGEPHAKAELEPGIPDVNKSAQMALTKGELMNRQTPAEIGLRNWMV